ncbi:polyketide synthase dehydratase domain-containing protein [Actinokineospora enzanensis]|uniref:polyketide synthase dehydratase domain-containing protein n=1 Tax=Actinokineospora enzanensis TaxID=155975 RepID=UPI00037625E1|nr:polyketide synthase dehydratase domain-containing protein [Actinokineospora enzanensis]
MPSARSELVAAASVAVEGSRVRAHTVVDPDEVYLAGHFPGLVVFPGVLFIDTLQQAVAAGFGDVRLVALRSVRFVAPVVAGDGFEVDAEVTEADGVLTARADCRRRSDGELTTRLHAEFERR